MLIAQTSKIEVVNATGKESYLPVAFYRRMMAAGSTYTDPGTGEAIQIVDAGEVEMISVTTNYSPAVGLQHATHLDPSARYCLFAGGVIAGRDVRKDTQLLGRSGMYVVQAASKVTIQAYRINVSAVDTVYTAERQADGPRR